MKRFLIIVFLLLFGAVIVLTSKVSDYQGVLAEKEERIEKIRGHLVTAELELEEKDKYIKELHQSVESLNADLSTLEEKLNELEIFKNKLE